MTYHTSLDSILTQYVVEQTAVVVVGLKSLFQAGSILNKHNINDDKFRSQTVCNFVLNFNKWHVII